MRCPGKGFTDVKGVDARARHRLVGNGWRWGVATRLLCMLVAHTFAAPASATPAIPAAPRFSTIDFVAGILKPGLSMACRPPQEPMPTPEHGVGPSIFWQLAADMVHAATARPVLEPAWEFLIVVRGQLRHDIDRTGGKCGKKFDSSSRTARRTSTGG